MGATLIALPAALAFERGGAFIGRTAGEALIALPLVAPEIVTAIATLVLFDSVHLRAGLGNVMLAHLVFCIPFALAANAGAAPRDAARRRGRSARPLRNALGSRFAASRCLSFMPAVIAGATLAFVVSLDDFLITLMVAPAGATTLPVYLYGMLRLGVTPEANAAAAILLMVSVTAVDTGFGAGQPSDRRSPR